MLFLSMFHNLWMDCMSGNVSSVVLHIEKGMEKERMICVTDV